MYCFIMILTDKVWVFFGIYFDDVFSLGNQVYVSMETTRTASVLQFSIQLPATWILSERITWSHVAVLAYEL